MGVTFPAKAYPALDLHWLLFLFMNKRTAVTGLRCHTFNRRFAYPALDLHVLESLFMNKLWAPIDRRKAYPALVLRGI